MKKVRIPWQENSPLHTPRGVYEFQDGIGYVDDETCQRLLAIYGDKIEVLDDKNNTEESSQDNARPSVSGKGNEGSNKKSRRKVSQDDT